MCEKVNFAWDVLIDDRIEAFPSLGDNHNGYSILMDTPYDQNCTDLMRVDAIVHGWGKGIKDLSCIRSYFIVLDCCPWFI